MATRAIDNKVAGNGLMVLPASVRKAMGLHPVGHGVSRAQALYREYTKHYRTTDDFLGDRRVEVAADLGEFAFGEKDRNGR